MNKYIQNIKMESNRCNKRERKREVQSQESSLYVPQTEREREKTKSESENEVRANVVCFNLVYCLRR